MADSINVPVAAGVWTSVIFGPVEALITATDNFHFASTETGSPPLADVVGHFRLANDDLVVQLNADEQLWARNPLRPFKLTCTVDEL